MTENKNKAATVPCCPTLEDRPPCDVMDMRPGGPHQRWRVQHRQSASAAGEGNERSG
jgi:hypothetical protein